MCLIEESLSGIFGVSCLIVCKMFVCFLYEKIVEFWLYCGVIVVEFIFDEVCMVFDVCIVFENLIVVFFLFMLLRCVFVDLCKFVD